MCYPVHPVLFENPSSPPPVVLPPPHQSRIAGRVRSHLPQWKKISGPWHTKTIMDGIPLQWVQDPPPFNRPFDSAISLRSRTRKFEGCSKTLQHQLEIGSVVPLLNQDETDGIWTRRIEFGQHSFRWPRKGQTSFGVASISGRSTRSCATSTSRWRALTRLQACSAAEIG